MGLKAIPMRADTGPIGGDLSHEFIILASTGESEVFCHADYLGFDDRRRPTPISTTSAACRASSTSWTSLYAATSEMHDAAAFDGDRRRTSRLSARGIEVGHIFYFGTKYSAADGRQGDRARTGRSATVHMGSYGIGPSRLVAAIIEASHDEQRHHLAGRGRALRRRAPQPEGRRRRDRRGLRAGSTATLDAPPAATCSTTTATSARAPSSPPPT